MPNIQVLDTHVADLIAAGEVVERPASAVKELVENAVDAGATQVTVEIQNGGMTYLRVTDNGCGIDPDEAETAFLRHATSKLRTKEDLGAIGTLGFRGEALAAIASVSKIDLMTKMAGKEGLSLQLEGGKVVDRAPAGCPDGTTIIVRELFYNTPARLKFMKRDTVEASQVAGAVQRQALAHTNVSFRLIRDGETILQTAGTGDLHGTVYQVYGRQLAVDMMEVKSTWEKMQLFGFVTKPTATRGNRGYQQFFVNGRPVKSRLLTSALEEAYRNQLMIGRFPSCVLCLELPPEAVDVNVHPAKTEVKFASEKQVFDCVHYGVLSTLNRTPGRPEMHLPEKKTEPSARPAPKQEVFRTMNAEQYKAFLADHEPKPVAPQVQKALQQPVAAPRPVSVTPPPACWDEPVKKQPAPIPTTVSVGAGHDRPVVPNPAPIAEQSGTVMTVPCSAPPEAVQEPEQTELPMPQVPDYRVVGEVLNCYIIIEQGDNVLFMDKHAAHERINFERMRASEEPIVSQVLLAPLSATLTREEAGVVLENTALMEQCGFFVEDFGDGTVLIRQIPMDLDEDQAQDALVELAGDLLNGQAKDPDTLRDDMLHTIACKASIKGGWHTEPRERDDLVRQVMERDDIKYCPHGRPVITTLTKRQIEKQFKRV